VSDGFLSAIQDIADNAQLDYIIAALHGNNLDEAIFAIQMSPAAFATYTEQIRQTYIMAGTQTAAGFPPIRDPNTGMRLAVRFDGRNTAAETFLAETAGQSVTNINNQQLLDLREAMSSGLIRGDNPKTVALDIVGRIDSTGRRAGGKIGLTGQQMKYVDNARDELRSGDPARLANYLTRARRDKRFDATVLKAIRSGEPISPDKIVAMVGRYSDLMLQLRGETIARTEVMTALAEAQAEAMRQVLKTGGLKSEQVKKVWRTAGDGRVRDSHQTMDGQEVGIDEPFISGDGNSIMYPCDPEAPAEEVINCRCIVEDKIDYFAGVE
jgi:Phage Mu protein F like protein